MKITSDHSGFAGVRSTAMQHPPENIRSPELSNLAQVCFPGRSFLAGNAGVPVDVMEVDGLTVEVHPRNKPLGS